MARARLRASGRVGDGLSDIALEIADGDEGFETTLPVLLISLLFLGVKTQSWPVSPWRYALSRQRLLPSGVVGPVEWLGRGVSSGCSPVISFSFANKNGPLSAASLSEGVSLS